MTTYNFNVLNGDETVAAIQSVILGNSRAIWPKVAELAWSVGEAGGQIRVTDQAGSVVVLVGVNSARRVSRFSIAGSGEFFPGRINQSLRHASEARVLRTVSAETPGAEEPQLFLI